MYIGYRWVYMVYVSRKTLCSRVYIPYEKLSKVSRCSMCFSQLNLHKWWTMNHQIIWMQQMSSAHWAAYFNVICFQRSGITDMCMNFVSGQNQNLLYIIIIFTSHWVHIFILRAFVFVLYKLGMYYGCVWMNQKHFDNYNTKNTPIRSHLKELCIYISWFLCHTSINFFFRKRCEKTSSTDFISITSFINHTFRDFSWQFHSI